MLEMPKPNGVIIYYNLASATDDAKLVITESDGTEIMSFEGDAISKNAGLNRFVWDMRYPNAKAIPGKPKPNVRPFCKPGKYLVKLSVKWPGANT